MLDMFLLCCSIDFGVFILLRGDVHAGFNARQSSTSDDNVCYLYLQASEYIYKHHCKF